MAKKKSPSLSTKAGLPPGSLIHLGKKRMDQAIISIIRFSENSFEEYNNCSIEEVKQQLASDEPIWVNIDGIHDVALMEEISKLIDLSPLLMEDILNTYQRPRYEEFDHMLYLSLKMIGISPNERSIASEQLSFVLGHNYIFSFQEREGDIFDSIRSRLREGKGQIRLRGAEYLFFRFIDTVVDHYFLITEHFSALSEDLEDRVLADSSPEILKEIQRAKKTLLQVRKAVVPLREVVGAPLKDHSPLLSDFVQPYLKTVYENVIQVIEWCETQREVVGSIMDLYLSEVSNRMNQVMQVLTIIATIFIPLTFIAGIYGMNFEHIPELGWEDGYLYFWILIAIIAILMVIYFRRKRWL
jgi:magnesium transporter